MWNGGFWRRLRMAGRRGRLTGELEEEMRLHEEMRAAKLRASGIEAEEARYAARRLFGSRTRWKEASGEMWTWNWMERWMQDGRYALRAMRRSPGFTAAAVLTLALGIGANAAIFTLLDALLFKPLPVAHPERIERFEIAGDEPQPVFCYPALAAIERRARSYTGMFTWNATRFSLGWGADARQIDGAVASGEAYGTLGLTPRVGRLFTREDDTPGAPMVAVISDGFWASEFRRDPKAIGRTILLDRQRFTIVGVTPRNFFGILTGMNPRVTIPFFDNVRLHPQWRMDSEKGMSWLTILARRKPGVTELQARAEARVISSPVMEDLLKPGGSPSDERKFLSQSLDVAPGGSGDGWLATKYRQSSLVLVGISGLLLLVACVNLANLLLARAAARQREMSVRLALGAGRMRLVRQALTESLMLAVAGAALGEAFASWTSRLIELFLKLDLNLAPDARIMGYLAAVAIGAALLFGLAPAVQGTNAQPNEVLKRGRIGGDGRSGRWSLSKALVPLQVGLTTMLLVSALLFARTLENLKWQGIGFDRNNVVFIPLSTEKTRMNDVRRARFFDDLLGRVRTIPFVKAASLTTIVPLEGSRAWDDLSPALWPELSEAQRKLYLHEVAPQYFLAMGTAMIAGRDFWESDGANGEMLAILNDFAARTYFPKQSAVGQLLRMDKEHVYRIIGVVADAKYGSLREPAPRTMYRSATAGGKMPFDDWTLVIRAEKDARPVEAAVRALLRTTGRDIAIGEVQPLDEVIDASLKTERLVAALAMFFAALAMALVAIGLYGLMSYTVARRTNEIGVRLALGAAPTRVLRMVLYEALAMVAAGLAIGIPAALAIGRLFASMLYGVKAADSLVMTVAAALIFAVCAIAAYLPARRAARLDPMTALRCE